MGLQGYKTRLTAITGIWDGCTAREKNMGYHIKYEELSRVRESMLSQLDSWLEQIESLKGSLRMAADMPEMKARQETVSAIT